MIGKKYNNTHKQGQVLLITVMLLATAITIVMTVAYNTTTETQISTLEQESQRALSAAEAGLELSLKNNPNEAPVSLNGLVGEGITGKAEVLSNTYSTFATPLIQEDESYTFYLGAYSTNTPVGFTGTYFSGKIYLYFGNKLCEPVGNSKTGSVLEILRVRADGTFNRYLVDRCHYLNENPLYPPLTVTDATEPFIIDNDSFWYKTELTIPDVEPTQLLVVRVLYNSTSLAIEGQDVGGNRINLPLQGKVAVSEARTTSGVTKRIQLFQSYPQFPTDFFVTSF